MTTELFYRTNGQGPPLVILHGLFGASDNWMHVAKLLGQQFTVYIPDQRNHGQSFHHPVFNYEVMAEDLNGFIEQHQLEQPIIVGHSMGGKVAMFHAQKYSYKLSKLVVVDIAPRAYPVQHQAILEGMSQIDLTQLTNRQEADRQLIPFVPEMGIRQFLLKNLSRNQQGGFQWKLNLPAIREQIEQVGEALPDGTAIPTPTLFMRGALSNYIEDQDLPLIQKHFPKTQVETIADAGHWVHAQKPELFLETLHNFILTSRPG